MRWYNSDKTKKYASRSLKTNISTFMMLALIHPIEATPLVYVSSSKNTKNQKWKKTLLSKYADKVDLIEPVEPNNHSYINKKSEYVIY